MKRFLNIFFVTLGVVFFIVIIIAGYFFITDPLNLKPLIFDTDPATSEHVSEPASEVDKHPLLTETQEKTLETFGINVSDVPSEITPEQERCFETAIGKARVTEIKNGDSPSALEFFKAKDCI